jgi:hypothetical protein
MSQFLLDGNLQPKYVWILRVTVQNISFVKSAYVLLSVLEVEKKRFWDIT